METGTRVVADPITWIWIETIMANGMVVIWTTKEEIWIIREEIRTIKVEIWGLKVWTWTIKVGTWTIKVETWTITNSRMEIGTRIIT